MWPNVAFLIILTGAGVSILVEFSKGFISLSKHFQYRFKLTITEPGFNSRYN